MNVVTNEQPRWSSFLSSEKVKLYISCGLFILGFNFVTTAEYVYFREILGNIGFTSEIEKSIILTVALIALCLGVIIGGVLSDASKAKLGKRTPVIFFGTVISSILFLFIPVVIEQFDNLKLIFYLLVAVFSLSHVSLGIAYSPWLALLPEYFRKNERIIAAIVINVISAIGAAIATVSFSFLIDHQLHWLIWIITGGMVGLTGIATFLLVPKKPSDGIAEIKIREIVRIPYSIVKLGGRNWILLLLISSFWSFGTHLIETGIVHSLTERFFVNEAKASLGSNILMGCYVVVMIIPLIIVCKKIGKLKSSIAASGIYGLFCLLLATMKDFTAIYYIVIIGGAGNIFISTFQIALPADSVPRGREASFLGFFFVFGAGAKPIASFIQGGIIEGNVQNTSLAIYGGYPWVFFIAAIIMFTSIVFLLFMKEEKNIKEYKMPMNEEIL